MFIFFPFLWVVLRYGSDGTHRTLSNLLCFAVGLTVGHALHRNSKKHVSLTQVKSKNGG